MTKRVLASILALIMVIGLLPAAALADTDACTAPETVTVTEEEPVGDEAEADAPAEDTSDEEAAAVPSASAAADRSPDRRLSAARTRVRREDTGSGTRAATNVARLDREGQDPVYYTTLELAVGAVQDGDVVTLIADYTTTGKVGSFSRRTFTLNLSDNGTPHTLTIDPRSSGSDAWLTMGSGDSSNVTINVGNSTVIDNGNRRFVHSLTNTVVTVNVDGGTLQTSCTMFESSNDFRMNLNNATVITSGSGAMYLNYRGTGTFDIVNSTITNASTLISVDGGTVSFSATGTTINSGADVVYVAASKSADVTFTNCTLAASSSHIVENLGTIDVTLDHSNVTVTSGNSAIFNDTTASVMTLDLDGSTVNNAYIFVNNKGTTTVDVNGADIHATYNIFSNTSGTMNVDCNGGTVSLTGCSAFSSQAGTTNIDLHGITITASNSIAVNNKGGTVNLDLNGGTITGTSTSSNKDGLLYNTSGATMNVDLNGGTIFLNPGAASTSATTAVHNYGTMTITDTGATKGVIKNNAWRTSSSLWGQNSVTASTAVLNEGSGSHLTMNGVALEEVQTSYNCGAAVLVNWKGNIEEIKNCTLTGTKSYGILNLGAKIENLEGTTISARQYAVYNRNQKGGSCTQASPYVLSGQVADIVQIKDCTITTAADGVIMNYAHIGTITGDTHLENASGSTCVQVRGDYWYYDTNILYSDGGAPVRTYTYDTQHYASIDSITGNTTLKSYSSYALIITDGGYVGEISGNARLESQYYALKLQTANAAARIDTKSGTASDPAAFDGDTIIQVYTYNHTSELGTIKDNVVINATGSNAIWNCGYIHTIAGNVRIITPSIGIRNGGQTKDTYAEMAKSTYIYESHRTNNLDASTEYARSYYYTFDMEHGCRIDTIGGEGSNVQIQVTSTFAITNTGYIGSVNHTTITATAGYTESTDSTKMRDNPLIQNCGDRMTGLDIEATSNPLTASVKLGGTTYAAGKYVTLQNRTYHHDGENYPATIGEFSDNTVTTPKSYALRNDGLITLLKDNTITANTYAVYNYNIGPYDGDRKSLFQEVGNSSAYTTALNSIWFLDAKYNYTCVPAEITTVEGNAITTGGAHPLTNAGYIGTLSGNDLIAGTSYGLNNGAGTSTVLSWNSDLEQLVAAGTQYAQNAAGWYPSNTATVRHDSYTYTQPTIDTVVGNNIRAGGNSSNENMGMLNSGVIHDFGLADGEPNVIYSTVTDGLRNHSGSYLTRTCDATYSNTTGSTSTSNNVYTYVSARIDSLVNTQIRGAKYGINTYGSTSYTDVSIGEIGDGVVVYGVSTSGGAGLSISNGATVGVISGGDFRFSDTGLRDSAVVDPDAQTYADGYMLSLTTRTTADPADPNATGDPTEGQYYYVVRDSVKLSFDANAADAEGSMDDLLIHVAGAALALDNSTLPANGYTREGYRFLGWALTADATEPAFADGYAWQTPGGEGEDPVPAATADFLASVGATGMGEDVTLYAVWLQLHTVTFDPANGGETTAVTVDANTAVARPETDPVKDEYTFDNWQLDGADYDFEAPVTGDITLVAAYTANFFTVQYDANTGTGTMADQRITIYPADTAPNAALTANSFLKSGNRFLGWALEAAAAEAAIVDELSGSASELAAALGDPARGGTVVLFAVWKPQHTVTFDPANGDDPTEVVVDEGTAVAQPATDPVKELYTFDGWYAEGSADAYDFTAPVTGDFTLTARYHISDPEARVEWADGTTPNTYYFTLAEAVADATHTGDTVVLMKDLAYTSTITVPAGRNINIKLADGENTFQITGSRMFLNSNAGATVNLDLGGSDIIGTYSSSGYKVGTVNRGLITNASGTMNIDLNGGDIILQGVGQQTSASYAVWNNKIMTVTDTAGGGVIANDGYYSAENPWNDSKTTHYNATAIYNTSASAQLTIGSVRLEQRQNYGSGYAFAIVNWNGARLSMDGTTIYSAKGRGLLNFSGRVSSIRNCTITVNNEGIVNQSYRQGDRTQASPYSTPYVGTITEITDTVIQCAGNYGIMNYGNIGTVGGDTTITAAAYGIYTSGSSMYGTTNQLYSVDSGNTRTYIYDTTNTRGITAITGDTQVTVTGSYALFITDGAQVGEVSGNASFQSKNWCARVAGGNYATCSETYTGTAANPTGIYGSTCDTYYTYNMPSSIGVIKDNVQFKALESYALHNGAYIGSITGNVQLSAASYGLMNGGFTNDAYSHLFRSSYHYVRVFDGPYNTNENHREYTYTYDLDRGARIDSIGGPDSSITITVGTSNGISNAGSIGSMENVHVSATTGHASNPLVQNTAVRMAGLSRETYNDGKMSITTPSNGRSYTNKYGVHEFRTYIYDDDNPATIGTIKSCDFTTPSGMSYAFRNAGWIDLIEDCTFTAGSYALQNYYDGYYTGTRESFFAEFGGNSAYFNLSTDSSSFTIMEAAYAYTKAPAHIGTIKDCTATTTSSGYVLQNGGYIGLIDGGTYTSAAGSALNNVGSTVVSWTSDTEQLIEQQNTWIAVGSSGWYEYIKNSVRSDSYVYGEAVIDKIVGATFVATSGTGAGFYNASIINQLGDVDGEAVRVVSSGNRGVHVSGGTSATRTVQVKRTNQTGSTSNQNNVYTYNAGRIGKIENTLAAGATYGIHAYYEGTSTGVPTPVIEEIGEGTVAYATNAANGGAGAAAAANGRIDLISGGDFKRASGETRADAVKDPDAQTYPEGYTLSYDTELAVNPVTCETEAGFYYVTPATVTLVFDGNSGTGEMEAQSITVLPDTVTIPAVTTNAFEKENYTFLGWALTDDATEAAITDGQTFETVAALLTALDSPELGSEVTLYAVWQLGTHEVTFDLNGHGGETAPEAQTVTHGETASAPDPAPADDDYELTGWYKEAACETAWDFEEDTVTEDTTLFAGWTEKTYTITYHANGGTGDDYTQTIGKVTAAALTANAFTAPANKTFAGWNTEADGTGATSYTDEQTGVTLTENIDLYAQWAAVPVTITFHANGGTGDDYTQTAEKGEETTLAANTFTAPTGKEFDSWNTEANGGGTSYEDGAAVTLTADTDLYAQWADQTFTVTWYDYDGNLLRTDENVTYGSAPSYGSTPTKASTDQYEYTFAGWASSAGQSTGLTELPAVTADVSYYAAFSAATRSYTITFVNEDGTQLQSGSVAYGSKPTYSGATPEKPDPDPAYDYTFTGWDPEITSETTVTGDQTYTAVYSSAKKTYTVAFDMNGGTPQEDAQTIEHGGTVTQPSDPNKDECVFAGWYTDSACTQAYSFSTPVTSSFTLYAKWETKTYTIRFLNDDGDVISTQTLAKNAQPEVPADPTKEETVSTTYTFAGWDPAVAAVTGDQDYTATYTSAPRQYTITWNNDDGTTIDTTSVAYGSTPSHADASKAATAQYTYTFAGWSPELTAVTGEATYTATFTPVLRSYTITFVDEDGTELDVQEVEYGTVPEFTDAEPEKEGDAQYSYVFAGWSPALTEVTGPATYTATYTPVTNTYTVTWANYDGTVLETDVDVAYGATPAYNGETPAKPADEQYTYAFADWTPTVGAITGPTTYTATYTPTLRSYTITFVDENGTQLDQQTVTYGTVPTYAGETPTKASDAQYDYAFAGWSPALASVTGEATYTAAFTATLRKYQITFLNYDGTELQSSDVEYGTTPAYAGETPTKPADENYTYAFAGWTPELAAVEGAATYTAAYTTNVTITFVNGEETYDQQMEKGVRAPLTANAFAAPEGKSFHSWNTAADGSGDTYYDQQPITPESKMTLYAQWVDYEAPAEGYTINWIDTVSNAILRTDEIDTIDALAQPVVRSYVGRTFTGWRIAMYGETVVTVENINPSAAALYSGSVTPDANEIMNQRLIAVLKALMQTGYASVREIDIYAEYTTPDKLCTITATYELAQSDGTTVTIGTISIPSDVTVGKSYRLQVEDTYNYNGEEYAFLYWDVNGEHIESTSVIIRASSNAITVKAVYAADEVSVIEEGPRFYVSDTFAETINGVNKVAATLVYDLPETPAGYRMVKLGFYYATGASGYTKLLGDTPADLTASKTGKTPGDLNGSYTLHVAVKATTSKQVHVRAYAIYKDPDGEEITWLDSEYHTLVWDELYAAGRIYTQ